jgi:hypothetical protein
VFDVDCEIPSMNPAMKSLGFGGAGLSMTVTIYYQISLESHVMGRASPFCVQSRDARRLARYLVYGATTELLLHGGEFRV